MNRWIRPWIFEERWNEMIFHRRNHEYGAYQLRKQYTKFMTSGFVLALFIFLLLLILPQLKLWYSGLFLDKSVQEYEFHEVTLNVPPSGQNGLENLPRLQAPDKKTSTNNSTVPNEKIIVKPRVVDKDLETPKNKINPNHPASPLIEKVDTLGSSGEISGSVSGSNNAAGDSSNAAQVYKFVSQMPSFAGCDELGGSFIDKKKCTEKRLLGFLKSNIRYPLQAIKNKTEGIVLVQFIIEKDGSVSNIKVLKEIGDGCGSETVRVLELLNSMKLLWTPGFQGKVPVRVQYTLPVEFEGS